MLSVVNSGMRTEVATDLTIKYMIYFLDNCAAQGFNGEDTTLLWAPFMFVGLWLMIDLVIHFQSI